MRTVQKCRSAVARTRTRVRRLFGGVVFDVWYLLALRRLSRSLSPASQVAVCIHIFYLDQWGLLARRLDALAGIPFDLFVTIPREKRRFAAVVQKDFPNAHVVTVPNRGRGTLPFLQVAKVLREHRYEAVLKLHCKNSGRAQQGEYYLRVVLDRLLPASHTLMREMVDLVIESRADLVGPSETYLPLSVAFRADRARIGVLLAEVGGSVAPRRFLDEPGEYGFFAGSMFWARVEALAPLLGFHAYDFEPERGQVDGTLAHALERVFSLLPLVRGGQIFEVVEEAVRPRAAQSDNVVWW